MWPPKLRTGTAKYRQIVDALSEAIAHGELRPGDQLLPQRELAWKLNVNLSTVTKAYDEAARRHLISGQVGRGSFVLASSNEAKLFTLKNMARDVIDLSTNVPALPDADSSYSEAARALIRDDRLAIDMYHSAHLCSATKEAVANWLAWRGFRCQPENVLLAAGAQAGLLAVLLSLKSMGKSVLVESYTFPGMKAVARQLGLKLVPVECDEEGMKPAALLACARSSDARIAVVVANLQNPTGALMSKSRRAQIADVAEMADLLVIEDDVYGPLTDSPPLSAELGAHGILVSSFSKSVSPGLRFGFIVGGDAQLASLVDDPNTTSWPTSPLSLVIASRWIADGTAKRRAMWQRNEVLERWRLMTGKLGTGGRHPAPHAWLHAPNLGEDEVVSRCRALGVEVVPASTFAAAHCSDTFVRICLTAPRTRHLLSVAVEKLAQLGLRIA
ncbi:MULTISPECIES: PLP-dependent aminotransferase family protein [unclassified Bradyrhizobium]|uniref:aminotransferase-like domain-containing protein n=1 Tax=unclassified Bradyrhizobium TaxID=2631580 RepID=UPI00291647A6|nr:MULTISPECIES: PLP-dependent aminotransferase family protein [unclassified Bradyrhizobium]